MFSMSEDKRGSGTTLAMAYLTALYDKRFAALGCSYVPALNMEDIERMIPYIMSVQ